MVTTWASPPRYHWSTVRVTVSPSIVSTTPRNATGDWAMIVASMTRQLANAGSVSPPESSSTLGCSAGGGSSARLGSPPSNTPPTAAPAKASAPAAAAPRAAKVQRLRRGSRAMTLLVEPVAPASGVRVSVSRSVFMMASRRVRADGLSAGSMVTPSSIGSEAARRLRSCSSSITPPLRARRCLQPVPVRHRSDPVEASANSWTACRSSVR